MAFLPQILAEKAARVLGVRILVAGGRREIAPASRAFWASLAFAVAYLATAVLLLWQWDTPAPWSRLDFFSVGFLVVAAAGLALTLDFGRTVLRSREVMNEFTGITYDRQLVPLVTTLSVGELGIFLDYGHWRLVPALEQPWLQALGLALFVAAIALLRWADHYIHQQFLGDLNHRYLMTSGPFRYIRHPRHGSLILSKFAMAMAFASAVGFILALAWLVLYLRRIRLEEPHLRRLFGSAYDDYARRTARLIPGIY